MVMMKSDARILAAYAGFAESLWRSAVLAAMPITILFIFLAQFR